MTDILDIITITALSNLEATAERKPTNGASSRGYQGANELILQAAAAAESACFESDIWFTRDQLVEQGARISKGQPSD